MYYFVIADCNGDTVDDGTQLKLDFYLTILNDGRHFSEEEDGMILFYSTAFLVFGLVLGANTYQYIKDMIKYEMPESPILLLMMSVTL